jgi:phage I-like protein
MMVFPSIKTADTSRKTRWRASSRVDFGRIRAFCAKSLNFASGVSFVHNLSGGAEKLNCKTIPRRCKTSAARLANADPAVPAVEGATTEFEVLQGDFVQLAPYGQFPHQRGMQYFDHTDAQKLVDNFSSLKARLMRRFGGLPWYEGHPDTSPKDYPNKRAYGWIDQLEARNDGLYGHVKWTNAGAELVAEGHYKYFSPVWDAAPARVGGKTVLRPIELISVGFTNTPNMPVLPLSNEEQPAQAEEQMNPEILKALGFADGAKPSNEEIFAAWEKHTAEVEGLRTAANEKNSAETLLANERTAHETALENERKIVKNLTEQLDGASKAFDAERQERIELLIGNAISNGKITKGDADKWRGELKEDFAGKSVELANSKPAVKTEAITKDLGKQQADLEQGASPADQVRALANEKQKTQGISYDAAWQQVKKERPDLIRGMHQPKGATA